MNYLIVGLGNIGDEYHETRHNIGFMVLDAWAKAANSTFELKRHALVASLKFKGRTVYLVKPTTFMNLSGKAVQYWLQETKIPISNLIVVTDDIALPFGTLRMRTQGSAGGHNGLTHIEQTVQTNQYVRLRMGVGSDFPKGKQAEYVLSPFSATEKETMETVIQRALEGIQAAITIGAERAMNTVNTKKA